MPVAVRNSDQRRVETPNATMTTLASPTLGGSGEIAMWRVAMRAGQRGPRHVFDSEQIWSVTAGRLSIEIDGTTALLDAGDTLVIPGGAERQIAAASAAEVVVCGRAGSTVHVPGEAESRGTPPWIV